MPLLLVSAVWLFLSKLGIGGNGLGAAFLCQGGCFAGLAEQYPLTTQGMKMLLRYITRFSVALLVLGTAAPVMADGTLQVKQAIWNKVHTKAISGDRILFNGTELLLENLTCPDVTTELGRDAKALMNTFLRRAGHFECEVELLPDDRLRGHCTVAERRGLKATTNLSTGMVKSGLCHSGDQTKGIAA